MSLHSEKANMSKRLSAYDRGVRDGVFLAIEQLIGHEDEPTIAENLAGECGFTKNQLLYLSTRSGYKAKKMRQVIRAMHL